eukprot:916627-Amphidinium_carterae.1
MEPGLFDDCWFMPGFHGDGELQALRVSYERLEFLGDAILKLLTMCFIASMKVISAQSSQWHLFAPFFKTSVSNGQKLLTQH